MTKKTPIQLKLDPNKPEGNLKSLGGGKADEWNDRLSNLTSNALPIAYSKNTQSVSEACLAVSYGVMDMAPADPVETSETRRPGCQRNRVAAVPGLRLPF